MVTVTLERNNFESQKKIALTAQKKKLLLKVQQTFITFSPPPFTVWDEKKNYCMKINNESKKAQHESKASLSIDVEVEMANRRSEWNNLKAKKKIIDNSREKER